MHIRLSIVSLLFVMGLVGCATTPESRLNTILQGEHRDAKNVARDVYRRPVETLQFFDVQPNMAVGEIWPGGGWYTEILAPYLRDEGTYYAVGFSTKAKRTPQWRKNYVAKLNAKLAAHPDVYDQTIVTSLAIPDDAQIAPDNSLDRVLTFRNVHNWLKGDYAEGVFESMFNALKPGGVLGVVEHRAKPGTSLDDMITSGYVTEAKVIALAQAAGFEFVASSEVLANPKDTKDHAKGVWTLPPTLRLKDQDRARYLAIGESDRMALKFVKPE